MSNNIPKPTRYVNAFYKPVEGGFDKKEEEKQETAKERAARHRQERREELKYDASDEARWAKKRAGVPVDEVNRKVDNWLFPRPVVKKVVFDLDDALKNPELGGIKSVNIDPVSMAAETAVDLIEGAKEFIANPSLGGFAAMAVTAIPGKYADDFGGELVKKAIDRNPTKQINGRKILNSDMAGKAVQTKGGEVWFDFDGFPDFTPYAEKIVRVEGLTGNRSKDSQLAMTGLGMSDYNQKDMVWHHHQDGKSMMLVPKAVHSVAMGGVNHTGGSAVIKHNQNNPENILNYLSPQEKK